MHHNKRQQRFAAILFIVSTLQLFCLVYYYSTIYMTTVLEIQPQTNHPEIDGTARPSNTSLITNLSRTESQASMPSPNTNATTKTLKKILLWNSPNR